MFQLQSIDHCGHGIWVLISSLPNPGVVDLRRNPQGSHPLSLLSLLPTICSKFFFFFLVSHKIFYFCLLYKQSVKFRNDAKVILQTKIYH